MMQVPTPLTFLSWMNDRLPENIWACLVISVIPRTDALEIFKNIAALGQQYGGQFTDSDEIGISISELEHAPDYLFLGITETITKHPLGLEALRPLLLLDNLPVKGRWESALNTTPVRDDWNVLRTAVLKTLDHHSQESTDIRWLIILFNAALGRIHVMTTMAHIVDELLAYPTYKPEVEIMRLIRPTIRAMEMALPMSDRMLERNTQQSRWPQQFWDESLKKTPCIYNYNVRSYSYNRELSEARLLHFFNAYAELTDLFFNTMRSGTLDIKFEIVFGLGLYALALFSELITGHSNDTGLTGRLILKSLVDCRVTLAYLLKKDDPTLYERFRGFGTGQAKLALLKIQELEGDIPSFVTEEVLNFLANEDIYQEYVTIELGNWCKEDLRSMSIDSDTKDDYDKYYGWTSGFSHAQWSAIRDSCFITCFNPLHKLHRIPMPKMHRLMEGVMPDAVNIINKMLLSITNIYPGTDLKIDINLFSEHNTKK